jgi:DNA-binding NarL/FixJ family response regulator
MPKQKLGTGNKRAVLQRPGTSYTSPRALRLQQRRAKALDYRLQGRSYKAIGEAMKIHPSTAQDYVIHCMRDFVPRDKAEAVLQLELERLDQMQASVYKNAASGGYCGD